MAPRKVPKTGFFNAGRERALHAYITTHPLLQNLRNNPSAVLAAIDTFTHRHPMMTFSAAKIALCRRLLGEMRPLPTTVVECGTYVGASAIAWGWMLRELHELHGEREDGRVKVVTMERDKDFVRIARELVALAGLEDVVSVVHGETRDGIRGLQRMGVGRGQVDVLFLDHWEEAYLPDLRLCEELRLLRPGALVLADNTDYPGAPEYLEYVKAGGSGRLGAVRYESRSWESTTDKDVPSIVEASAVVEVP